MGSNQSTQLPTRTKKNRDDSVLGGASAVTSYGAPLRGIFPIDPSYHNLNHGSFGSIPLAIQAKQREYQDRAEARPDVFIRYEYPKLLDESRAAVATLLRVPTETVVFVSNATIGANTVLHNLMWADDCADEILYFSTIYGAFGNMIDYIVASRYGKVASRVIDIRYPIEDDEIVARFRATVAASRAKGKRPKICIFDVVSSLPGVRFPFEAMTVACKEEGIMSLVDGAQGIGMVDIDLGTVDPDFFVSNCHKWLHVPRGCAVFVVPLRNQELIQTTLPTSHGYVPKSGRRFNPLPPSSKSRFVNSFEFVGTIDNAPYLCVKDSIRWRKDVLGGEAQILEYQRSLAKRGGKRVAEILGTRILENQKGSLTDCAMVNVALPLVMVDEEATNPVEEQQKGDWTIPRKEAFTTTQAILQTLIRDYQTFIALFVQGDRWWARLSAQVYLSMEDFEWAGKTLQEVCKQAGKQELMAKAL